MRVIFNTQLIGDSQKQCVGLRDGLVLLELLDKNVRFGGIVATEDRSGRCADEADTVLILGAVAKIGAIAIVDEGEDAAADRHARFMCVAGFFPGGAESSDLAGLLDVEGFAGLIV